MTDKTGTLTIGRPEVTDVIALDQETEAQLLTLAAAVERRSEHPLAAGVLRAAEHRGLTVPVPTEFEVHPGEGALVDRWRARAVRHRAPHGTRPR